MKTHWNVIKATKCCEIALKLKRATSVTAFLTLHLMHASITVKQNETLRGSTAEFDSPPLCILLTENDVSLLASFLPFCLSQASANWPDSTSHSWTGCETWMCCFGRGGASPGPQKEGLALQNRCSLSFLFFFHFFSSSPFPLSSPHTC